MKLRRLVCVGYIVIMAAVCFQFLSPSTAQLNLSLALAACLLGILVFDEQEQVTSEGSETGLFVVFSTAMFFAINQATKENFFLAVAGTSLIVNLFSEMEADSWQGRIIYSSPLVTTVLFFVLIILECIPNLSSTTVLLLDVEAIAVLALQELLCLSRQNANQWAGSFQSSLRLVTCGFTSYLYGHFFLPQIANQDLAFMQVCTGLAVVAVLVAIAALFQSQMEKKQIHFNVVWSLLILWGALLKNNYIIVLAVTIAPWVVLATRNRHEETFSKVFSFACPGSLLFVPLVGILLPTEFAKIQLDLVLWAFALVIFWIGLAKTRQEKARPNWRQGALAFLTSIMVALAFAGINFDFIKERF